MNTQEQGEKLYERAPKLDQAERKELNGLFPSYIFRRRRTREVWTTCCGVHGELPPESEIMDAAHTPEPKPAPHYCHAGAMSAPVKEPPPKPVACPFCGKVSPVKELGRTGSRKNLWSYRPAAVLRWYRGALWAVCFDLTKNYGAEGCLTDGPAIKPIAVYRFAPGRVEYCRRSWYTSSWSCCESVATKGLRPGYKIPEPFGFCAEYGTGYELIGLDEVDKSPFRWCGFREYQRMGTQPVRYLALCTAYPRQVELLTKAGLVEAVADFVSRGKRNAAAFDWYDPDPRRGLGLNKTELKEFLAGGRDLEVLGRYKSLRREKEAASLPELYRMKRDLGGTWFGRVVTRMKKYRLSARRIRGYLEKARLEDKGRKKNGQPLSVIAGWWCDYVDAAQVLGYDLKNDVFLLPKDLKGHHDKATKAAVPIREAKRSAESRTKEARRLRVLARRYTFTDGRWLIRPPLNAAEIVAEGKALKHCVGGYADRHINGRTTILFLRDRRQPGKPLVTIEMKGAEIVQIHGWDDERTACKANPRRQSPRKLYAAFLEPWLAWVASGSKRDKKGYPVVPEEKKAGAA